jgi:hypothetical protein
LKIAVRKGTKGERDTVSHSLKSLILEIYDALAEAVAIGRPYRTRLDPPPADPRAAHQPRTEAAGS